MSTFHTIKRVYEDDRGATAVEYGLILSLIVLAMIGSLSSFADAATSMWSDVARTSAEAVERTDG